MRRAPRRRTVGVAESLAMAEHVTPLDATFLELEQLDEGVNMHIGAVMVFDPLPEGGAPGVERVREHLVARLDPLLRFRQRLSSARTGGLSWPTWEDDDRFDITAHVRDARLPAPGGEAELLDWASDFYSHRLDRSRPLWEMAVLDGLAGGRWALCTKTHHCMIDGIASVDVGHLMLDPEPEPAQERSPHNGRSGQPAEVADDGRGHRGPGGWLPALVLRGARAGVDLVIHPRHAQDLFERTRALAELVVRNEVVRAPSSSINVPIGGTRRLAVVWTDLEALKQVKRGLGGTVNDVVLAVVSGGLRRLLIERGERPPSPGLRAMVPVNLRSAGEQLALGNRITSLFVQLPVAEPDPLDRYEKTVGGAESLKVSNQPVGSETLLELTGLAPPVLHAVLARSLFATRLFNVTVTNVPGPPATLYAFGAPMSAVIPLVPLAADHAIGIAVVSYDGRVCFGLCADRTAMPDLPVLARGIEDSLAELGELAASRSQVV